MLVNFFYYFCISKNDKKNAFYSNHILCFISHYAFFNFMFFFLQKNIIKKRRHCYNFFCTFSYFFSWKKKFLNKNFRLVPLPVAFLEDSREFMYYALSSLTRWYSWNEKWVFLVLEKLWVEERINRFISNSFCKKSSV